MAADLHLHSIYSDGSFTPGQLVARAKKKGITTIALSDHDTVAGLGEMREAATEEGIEAINAIEFSTFSGKAELHILGYFIDDTCPALMEKIDEIFRARIERARLMVKKLNEQGINISWHEVKALAGDDYVGRPHLARAMENAGYVSNIAEAFTDEYIGNKGKAYVPKYKLAPAEAIDIIAKAGGIPVLAHPYFVNHGEPCSKNDIIALKEEGLAGLEVYHSKHDAKTTSYYLEIAQELNLLITGGSDFHGANSPEIKMGDVTIDDRLVMELKRYYKFKK